MRHVMVNCLEVSSVQRVIEFFRLDSETVGVCRLFLPSIARTGIISHSQVLISDLMFLNWIDQHKGMTLPEGGTNFCCMSGVF